MSSALAEKAARIGAEHGKNAGTWVFDGNTANETYHAVYAGIMSGDPAVLDAYRIPGLWDEDDYKVSDLLSDLDTDEDSETDESVTEYEEAYRSAAGQGFWDEVESTARDQVIYDYTQEFTQAYAYAMLWANASTLRRDDEDEIIRTEDAPEGELISFGDADIMPEDWRDSSPMWALNAFDPASQTSIEADCESFVRDNFADLYGIEADSAGHDFALSRNGHGAGFFDRGLGETGDRLQAAARAYGESSAEWSGEDGEPVTLM